MVCRTGSLIVRHDDEVIVETGDGEFLGRVTRFTAPVVKPPRRRPGRILRFAVAEESRIDQENQEQAFEIGRYVRQRARELNLEIRPIRAQIPLAGDLVLVFFTAEQRVDFRPDCVP